MCPFLNSHILYLERGGGVGGGVEGPPIMTDTGRRNPEVHPFQDRPYHFFFNFWHGQAKETLGKNVLKLVKLPSFEGDL